MKPKKKVTNAAAPAPPAASPLGPALLTGDTKSKIDQVSSGGLASQVNPELRNRIGASQQDLTQQFQRQILPGLSRAAEGAGRFGSDAYQMAQGEAATGLTRALGDIESNMTFQDYNARMADMMAGLGMGNQQYMQGQDINSQQLMQGRGIQSQEYMQGRGIDSQEYMQGVGIDADKAMQAKDLEFKAAQAMQQGDFQTAQLMMQAASQMSAQQSNALGNLPGIDQMGGMGALSQLLSQSTGLDAAAIQAILEQQNQGLQRQGLQQDQQRINLAQQGQQYGQQQDAFAFMNQNPWDVLNQYGNLVNGIGGQYGTTIGTGNQTTPYMGPSPSVAAIQGGIGTWNLLNGMSGGGGSGGGGGGASYYNNNPSGQYWAGNPW